MKTGIYARLVRYFIGLILVTCLACALLFLATLGRPMAREAHQLVRNHVGFLAGQVQAQLADNDRASLKRFMETAARAYGIDLFLFDNDLAPLLGHTRTGAPPTIHTGMVQTIAEKGRWVQSGHFTDSTAYVVPLNRENASPYYLYLAKPSMTRLPLAIFAAGLGLLCALLILAIYPLARSFTRPIHRLSACLDDMASGKFTPTAVPARRPAQRQDELGRLEQAYARMADSVKEMMASKKRLLADISHELRSPLGRMEVATELLADSCRESKNGEGIRQADMLAQEIRFMADLVRALSHYARINLPEFTLKREPVAPGSLLRDLFARNQAIMARQGIDLKLDPDLNPDLNPNPELDPNPELEQELEQYPADHLPRIQMDRNRILMVLQNLLDNARQHTPEGNKIILGARILKSEQGNGQFCFFVSDPGPGIRPGQEEKIFEPLFRADTSRNRNTGGLGLGLAISRRIVDLCGGSIQYRRENNRTVFSVYLNTETEGTT